MSDNGSGKGSLGSPGSDGATASWPDDAVEVGRILDAYGVKGWVKVQPYSSDATALLASRKWFLKRTSDSGQARKSAAVTGPSARQGVLAGAGGSASSSPASGRAPETLNISISKPHGDIVVAQAREVTSRDGAEALRGLSIFVSRSSFPAAAEDEYYWVDLLGLDVVNLQGEALGKVVGLIDTGPHSVIQVAPAELAPGQKPEDAERLIPFVGAYVQTVSLSERRITVDWGLDY